MNNKIIERSGISFFIRVIDLIDTGTRRVMEFVRTRIKYICLFN